MNENNLPVYYKKWFVLVAFILIWPVGLILAYLRMKELGQNILLAGADKKFYFIGAFALVALGLFQLIAMDNKGLGIFALIGGVAVFLMAESLSKRSARYQKYYDMVVNQKMTSIDAISGVVNINYDVCVKELKMLISLGVLKNYSVNDQARMISYTAPQQSAPMGSNVRMNASMERVCVKCPGCGSDVMVVKGSTSECEYCGSSISA